MFSSQTEGEKGEENVPQQNVEAVLNALVGNDERFLQFWQVIQAAVEAAQVAEFTDEDRTALLRRLADMSETDEARQRWIYYWEKEPLD